MYNGIIIVEGCIAALHEISYRLFETPTELVEGLAYIAVGRNEFARALPIQLFQCRIVIFDTYSVVIRTFRDDGFSDFQAIKGQNKGQKTEENIMEKSTFEALGGSYIRVGDYLFPDLIITDSTPLGKWGQLRKQYLKERCPALYSSMLLTGKLNHHLAEIDHDCQERMDLIVAQLHKQEGITESLKSSDQMEWVRRANSIQHRAEELVLHELVCC